MRKECNDKIRFKDLRVACPWLPDRKMFDSYIDRIFTSGQLTNNGPILQEFSDELRKFLNVKYVVPVANGTLALQVAYSILGINKKIITTPFSFVASTSSMAWQGIKPVFSDIDKYSLCLDPDKIVKNICIDTQAILPVHVYGNICDVEKIESIANKHKLKLIYDASHSFDIYHNGQNILSYGDISTISFHATKLFHTIEGGAIVANNEEDYSKIMQAINFGYEEGIIKSLGINAKMNEFQAAMGLCLLKEYPAIKERRKKIYDLFRNYFDRLEHITLPSFKAQNYSYFPIIFRSPDNLKRTVTRLERINIFPRRYFYPPLNRLPYIENGNLCEVAADISERILCMPMHHDILESDIQEMSRIVEGEQ